MRRRAFLGLLCAAPFFKAVPPARQTIVFVPSKWRQVIYGQSIVFSPRRRVVFVDFNREMSYGEFKG